MLLRRVTYKEREIIYSLTWKKVKNVNLRINADKEILVSAPKYVKVEDIDRFVLSKAEKIIAVLNTHYPDVEDNVNIEYLSGDKVKLLGKEIRLEVFENTDTGCVFDGERLILHIRGSGELKNREKVFLKWKDAFCREIFSETCKRIFPLFQRYNIAYPEIKIRRMKTRWGSCTPARKKITLNAKLIEKPIECIEYVVAHEFAHFIEPNHSPDFYGVLDNIMPDWKIRKNMLNN